MQKKSSDFSVEQAMELAKNPAGQQLLALLQKNNTNAVAQAIQQASAGDYAQAAQTLGPLLESEEIRQLLQQLGG